MCRLTIYKGDKPEKVASDFKAKYNIGTDIYEKLVIYIQDQIKALKYQ